MLFSGQESLMMASFTYLYPTKQSHGRLDERVATYTVDTNYV